MTAMALLTTASCLVTDDLQAREPPDPPVNTWPRVVESSATPSNWVRYVPKSDDPCAPFDLSIGKFADPDVNDTLYVHAFVDHAFIAQDVKPPSGTVERIGYTYKFDPKSYCQGYHVVKVLVADGRFAQEGDFDALETTDGGTDRGVASYTWAVDTSQCVLGGGPCR